MKKRNVLCGFAARAVLAVGLPALSALVFGCASTPPLEKFKSAPVREVSDAAGSRSEGHFVTEGYLLPAGENFVSLSNFGVVHGMVHGILTLKENLPATNIIYTTFNEESTSSELRNTLKRYRVWISIQRGFWGRTINDIKIHKIEGPLPLDAAALAKIAEKEAEEKREAEKKAEKERQKAARAEANKFDPAKFVFFPNNWGKENKWTGEIPGPADYKKADLFDAVAEVKDWRKRFFSEGFVSDVVFLSQNGTDILFETADKAISQSMNINSRSGLTRGQKVRVYYTVTKNPITDWHVDAIEKL